MHRCFTTAIKLTSVYEVVWIYCNIYVVNLLHVSATLVAVFRKVFTKNISQRHQNQCTNIKYV